MRKVLQTWEKRVVDIKELGGLLKNRIEGLPAWELLFELGFVPFQILRIGVHSTERKRLEKRPVE